MSIELVATIASILATLWLLCIFVAGGIYAYTITFPRAPLWYKVMACLVIARTGPIAVVRSVRLVFAVRRLGKAIALGREAAKTAEQLAAQPAAPPQGVERIVQVTPDTPAGHRTVAELLGRGPNTPIH